MSKVTLLPADTYIVVNKTIFTDYDRLILTLLYQPIIGHLPLSLYFTLWADLDKAEIMSITFNHHHLMTNMQLKLNRIELAREKLEAMGLLKVYFKKGDINHYLYQLYSPLSADEFLNDPILNVLLYSYIGSNEYNQVTSYFKIPKIKITDFEDITTSFSDIFKTSHEANNLEKIATIKRKTSNQLSITEEIDFPLITSSIPSSLLNNKAFDSKTKTLINKLSFLYNIDTLHMINIIRGCLNEKGCVDKAKLRMACRNYYRFENDDYLPKLIYRSQPTELRKKDSSYSKRSIIIHQFESLSPYEFLIAKYNGGNPTIRDKMLIERLMIDQQLNPGVVNVLIDYILKIKDHKLNRQFVETIAGQWKRLNIKTVLEAMTQAEKEHKKYKKRITSNVKTVKEAKLPEWFGKDIKKEKISDEEEAKLKDMLKEFT